MSYPTKNDPELEAQDTPQPTHTDSDDNTAKPEKSDEVIFTDWAAF